MIRAYYDRFTSATLNVPGHEEFLVNGAFAYGPLHDPLSKKMQGMAPQSIDELKYSVKKYLWQIKGEEWKEANLKVVANAYIKQEEVNSHISPNDRDHHERSHDRSHEKHNWHSRPHLVDFPLLEKMSSQPPG